MSKKRKKPYMVWALGRVLPKTVKWDAFYLKLLYKAKMGKRLNLDNPQTFNEKLQWLKLYDRNPEYIKMVDKYEAKKYVASIIGEEYIIPTLGVWDRFDDIDFDKLPDQFVLKCTHDSGGLVICKDKNTLDIQQARKKINHCLKRNYYLNTREWPYKNVKPRIIAEKYMEDEAEEQPDDYTNTELKDYKLMCFGGKVECSFVCSGRYSEDGLKVTFYNSGWKMMPFERHYPREKEPINIPTNYNKMVRFAEILSNRIPFVRVDLYEINKKLYFGEMTFFPGSGYEEFTPDEWDWKLGSWIRLPDQEL